MAQAKIDDQELFSLVESPGLKNLDSFRVQSALIKLTKKYTELKTKEPLIAYNYLGMLEAYKNNYKTAIQLLENALKISQNDWRVLHNLAKFYERNGNYDEAVRYYKKTIEQVPESPITLSGFFRLIDIYSDFELFNKLQNSYPKYFSEKNKYINFYEHFKILENHNFDFDLYKVQLNCANKSINQYYVLDQSSMKKYYSNEAECLITTIELKAISPDVISQITTTYEDELYQYAEQQEDGGFSFFKKLNQSVITFDLVD